jgi:hypothetical protein
MELNKEEQEILLEKLKEILTEVDFGRIFCTFVVSDKCLMYFDIKRETIERIYIHSGPGNKEDV